MAMLARLKAYNKKRGHVLRRVNYRGLKFEAARGWYKVDDAVAAYLATVHQDVYDEDSPLAFDVMTQEAAKGVAAAEIKAAEVKATAANPIEAAVDTTTKSPPPAEAPARSTRKRRTRE